MKKNENGRSMVEMLGVLAIIGVLSVAGIAGYTVAIRKHRANEIAQAVSMLAVAASTANGGITTTNDDYTEVYEGNTLPTSVSTLKALSETDHTFKKEILLVVDDEKLCSAVVNIFGESDTTPLYISDSDCETGELTIKTM